MSFVVPVRASKKAHFTTEQKLAILDEYDKCIERGAKAEFARTIGVGTNTLHGWFQDREAGCLSSRSDSSEGNSVAERLNAGDKKQLKRLEEENRVLKAKLAKSEAAVDILGKASALLEAMSKSATANEPEMPEPEPDRPEWLGPNSSEK